MEGRSFAGLLAGQSTVGPARASWGHIADFTQLYVVAGDWKLLRHDPGGGPPTDELYHLRSDPGERRNLRQEQPERAAEMVTMLERWAAAKEAGQSWQPWER
jgi:arylsulfatase A-like enzyme